MSLVDSMRKMMGIPKPGSAPSRIDPAGQIERRQVRASMGDLTKREREFINMPNVGRSTVQSRKEAIRRAREANRRRGVKVPKNR